MGWTYTHREKGISNRDWFADEFSSIEILDCATIGGWSGTFYAACRHKHDGPDGPVWAMICMLGWRANDHFNFGYKDLDETMGPSDDDCPERVFKLLTPLEPGKYEWAEGWRARVAEKLARPKVKKGTKVRWLNSWSSSRDYGICTYTGKGNAFVTAGGWLVRFQGWRTVAYEVVA